ncbi:sigma-70 family RNA polymerase sigma factor [Turicibacter sanguinis]|nr:sigma-70 family RNA polymerase sigma factor [Turicibacter sanguinis]MTH10999.1 sigma-70 family RNA polymerase sigma factor [Turicibacter sanguinis]MTH13780.1 sigma-70 family RNA polymerase sigma factor [Turicibacter sanguinis]MTH20854.1 sigma-70 family RNA polymerase sigma factor [Turicibacter sanguinis]MTH41736.1 sigma-70 family RNA polymerase sigma factor [Turicibacter sanguinis]
MEYINDNLMFGSNVKNEVIEDLFYKYPVTNIERMSIYQELESLEITILELKESFKSKLDKLFSLIDNKKDVKHSELEKWFDEEEIPQVIRETIETFLTMHGHSIIHEKSIEITFDDFDSLVDLDYFDNLDDIFEDEKFNLEVSKLQNVIDKSENLKYLAQFHASEENSSDKSEAMNNISKANERLVWEIAKRYEQFATSSFDINDMVQAGMMGLIKAVEKFDISMGNQFSTYATWWIKQSITRSIADFSTTIRVPVHMREKIIKYSKIENQFWFENGRAPTDDELSIIIGTTVSDINDVKFYQNVANLTSLDIPIGTDEGSYLGDFICDTTSKSTEDCIEENDLKNELETIFNNRLKAKEKEILIFRFGLNGGSRHTLEEVGQIYGCTRERIRQIEAKAIRKLRDPRIIERLRYFHYD